MESDPGVGAIQGPGSSLMTTSFGWVSPVEFDLYWKPHPQIEIEMRKSTLMSALNFAREFVTANDPDEVFPDYVDETS